MTKNYHGMGILHNRGIANRARFRELGAVPAPRWRDTIDDGHALGDTNRKRHGCAILHVPGTQIEQMTGRLTMGRLNGLWRLRQHSAPIYRRIQPELLRLSPFFGADVVMLTLQRFALRDSSLVRMRQNTRSFFRNCRQDRRTARRRRSVRDQEQSCVARS